MQSSVSNILFYFRQQLGSLQVPIEIWTKYWEDEDTPRYEALLKLKKRYTRVRLLFQNI